ncbi:MAG: ROK family protein [Actinomycetes bacterium]
MTHRPENAHQARLLRLLRDGGPRSKAELGESLDLSRSKIGVEVDRLTTRSLVESAGLAASRGGRRSSIVRLSSQTRFLGIDIGATSVDVAVTDGELSVLAHVSEPSDVRDGPEAVIARSIELVGKLNAEGVLPEVNGAGVGIPGPVSFGSGVPVSPPIMPGWNQYPVREEFSTALGCPVRVDNDVNIMALGEQHAGIAKSADDFLFLKIGTGIGCGIIAHGEVYRGAEGSAGDIGHILVEESGLTCACGDRGCLEAYFGGAALSRDAVAAARAGRSPLLAERLAETGVLTAEDVGAAAAAGDPVAVELIRVGGRRLGQVLTGLVSFFNPSLVVIGGGLAGLGHALLAEIRGVVYRRSLPLATGSLLIVLSELGDHAGVIGAARLVSDHVFSAA